jgi:hypothetical protein
MRKITVLILLGVLMLGCQVIPDKISGENSISPACRPLPSDFTEGDLVGTWIAEYRGGLGIDLLIIDQGGLYKQIYSSEIINFESDWLKWSLEYDPEGYAILHLTGMRRCDDFEFICNDPGGGLPDGEIAINQCKGGYLTYSDEVILFVTGVPKFSRGIELQHARLAGSEWSYGFRLEE